MEPAIRVGERVPVHAMERVWPGDVVVFETGSDGYVLHRVVMAVPGLGWFVHAGDNGAGAGIARADAIVGRADVPRRLLPGMFLKGARRVARAVRRRVARRLSPSG